MKEILAKSSWCDYFTPCKHFENIYVGSFECAQCKFFKSMTRVKNEENEKIENLNPNEKNYMKRYFIEHTYIINCNYE